MRKILFWTVSSVLVLVLIGAAFFWVRSYDHSEQVTVRLGTPGVSVWTSDRGRLAVLMLGEQPLGRRWLMSWRVNEAPGRDTPTLDALCQENGLGFGLGHGVSIAGLEKPAVAGVSPDKSWAARRVVLPFWAVALTAAGTLAVWWLTLGVRIHRVDHGLCGKCSFDVSQASHFCPRCGKAIPKRTWSGDTRPRRRLAGAARA